MRSLKTLLVVVACVTCWHQPVVAQLSTAQLAKLKSATVYVRSTGGEGSGILVERTPKNGIIVTADHVVAQDLPNSKVAVIFNCGAPGEREMVAEVVARNPFRDIAFLKVVDNNLPQSLRMAPQTELTETQAVYVAGYPIDERAVAGLKPSLSISKNAITTVQRTPLGFLRILKLESRTLPGFSGGPVVNTENELIGIAVAHPTGATGWALPIAHAAWDMSGQCTIIYATQSSNSSDVVLATQVTDPQSLIESVSFEVGAMSDVKEPKLDTSKGSFDWPELKHRQKLDAEYAKLEYSCNLRMPLSGVPRDETFAQAVIRHKDGSISRSPPIPAPMWFGKYDQRIAEARDALMGGIDVSFGSKPKPAPNRGALPAQPSAASEATTIKLDKKSHFEQPAVSDVVRVEGRAMRRVLVGDVREAAHLFWSADGQQLYVQGEQLLRVNFPQADDIERFTLSARCQFSVADGLLIAVGENNSLTLLDSHSLVVKNCWTMRQPFKCNVAPGQQFALLTTTLQPEAQAFLCDLNKGIDAQELEFKVDGKPLSVRQFEVSPTSNSILAVDNTSLYRFSYRDGVAEHVDTFRGAMSQPLLAYETLPGSSANYLALLENNQTALQRQGSNVWLFTTDNGRAAPFMVKDAVFCVLDDSKRGRVLLGGANGIWEWRSDVRQVRSFPFPKSAPTVRCLALHPNGKTLAVLCNASPSSADAHVYWIQLD